MPKPCGQIRHLRRRSAFLFERELESVQSVLNGPGNRGVGDQRNLCRRGVRREWSENEQERTQDQTGARLFSHVERGLGIHAGACGKLLIGVCFFVWWERRGTSGAFKTQPGRNSALECPGGTATGFRKSPFVSVPCRRVCASAKPRITPLMTGVTHAMTTPHDCCATLFVLLNPALLLKPLALVSNSVRRCPVQQ